MKQARVFISGYVQGVGFRQFVKQKAKELGLCGWVGNTEDGRVEAVFQTVSHSGKQSASRISNKNDSGQARMTKEIKEMIKHCKKGPFLAQVENIEVLWEEAKEKYESFEISYSI